MAWNSAIFAQLDFTNLKSRSTGESEVIGPKAIYIFDRFKFSQFVISFGVLFLDCSLLF